jgi:hypothetical protein
VFKDKRRKINYMEKFEVERIFYETSYFVKQFLNQSLEERRMYVEEYEENLKSIKEYL